MGGELTHIIEFLYSVFTNWILLAGGAVMTAIGIGERLWRKQVHWKIYLGVLVCLLFVAFYMSWRDMRIALDAKPILPAPLSLDVREHVIDEESRQRITELQKQFDRLAEPIASAKFTILINFKDKKEPASNYIGSGVAAYLTADNDQIFLGGGTSEHASDGEGHSRVVIDCPFDLLGMGKPVRSLADAKWLELHFSTEFIPIDTELLDGKAFLVVNNEVTFNFKIPAQKVMELPPTEKEKQTWIRITDINIKQQLAALTTQPSPTPNMAASPP